MGFSQSSKFLVSILSTIAWSAILVFYIFQLTTINKSLSDELNKFKQTLATYQEIEGSIYTTMLKAEKD